MDQLNRPTGIPAVGEVPWGTHFCQFYRTGEDLADTLVSYFEAGLRNNESCLWVTGERLEAEEAEALMVKTDPSFKSRLSSGQMQIVPISKWYTPGDAFDADAVLQGWLDREKESRSRGFAGLRLTGDTIWVDRSGWQDFVEYEEKVNSAFRRYNLIALCTYCTDKCTAEDVVDVCAHHQFALTRRQGNWELLESSSLKFAKEQLIQQNGELEARVLARTAQLNSAIEARDTFLAMLGHELRNPLAPILNAASLIKAQTLPGSVLGRSAAVIQRQTAHMSRLVNDLLDVGRLTRGQLNLELSPVSIADVLEQALEQSRYLIDQRGHSLAITLPSRAVKVNGDAVRLAQVFANLLHNAAKYTPDGGKVTIEATVADDTVTVSVTDNGSGIPQDKLEVVFDLFAQLPRSLARSDGGLGIGLTLVKRLAEMHGGKAFARSAGPGQGSCFAVELPRHIDLEPVEERTDFGALQEAAGSCSVLLVDDNADAAHSLALLLSESGHHVTTAADGPAGLAAAKSVIPDVALLDIGLPGIDGYEVARRLKADPRTKHIHLIAVTGYGQDADVAAAFEAGFNDHLLKPADPQKVLARLSSFANRSRPN